MTLCSSLAYDTGEVHERSCLQAHKLVGTRVAGPGSIRTRPAALLFYPALLLTREVGSSPEEHLVCFDPGLGLESVSDPLVHCGEEYKVSQETFLMAPPTFQWRVCGLSFLKSFS